MLDFLYRASFLLYEVSFILLAVALTFFGLAFRRINQALRHPPFWIGPMIAAGLMAICAVIHFYVYHYISPQYLISPSRDLLLRMYGLKTASMAGILVAGLAVCLSGWLYSRKINR